MDFFFKVFNEFFGLNDCLDWDWLFVLLLYTYIMYLKRQSIQLFAHLSFLFIDDRPDSLEISKHSRLGTFFQIPSVDIKFPKYQSVCFLVFFGLFFFRNNVLVILKSLGLEQLQI